MDVRAIFVVFSCHLCYHASVQIYVYFFQIATRGAIGTILFFSHFELLHFYKTANNFLYCIL